MIDSTSLEVKMAPLPGTRLGAGSSSRPDREDRDQFLLPVATKCIICGSPKIRYGFTVNYWKEFPLRFFDCGDCHASFANPMPGNECIRRGNQALVQYYSKQGHPSATEQEARQSYLKGKVRGQKLKGQGRVLEVGSNHGFYLLGLQDASEWEVEGVEISDDLASFCRDSLSVKVHHGTLEQAGLQKNHYDLILAHDLIEHINQPDLFWKSISQFLAPGGIIEGTTPNAYQDLAYFRRLAKAGYSPSMLLNHICMYEPASLMAIAQRYGFKVETLYQYDIRYSPKDLGWFGLHPARAPQGEIPSIDDFPEAKDQAPIAHWSPQSLKELRTHPKTSTRYGWIRHRLPGFFNFKVPPGLKIGHEIFFRLQKENKSD